MSRCGYEMKGANFCLNPDQAKETQNIQTTPTLLLHLLPEPQFTPQEEKRSHDADAQYAEPNLPLKTNTPPNTRIHRGGGKLETSEHPR